ncbi:CopC domain-containing protein YobA [Entomohabitans teleogrylli]|uniref:CopC domain-containing protein YobA n=1 Tax=Entomohabitans teleogrylli TaxID=1384589 RepID=UPI00073D6652|nr:CopC domain-containing protein YobA [Entomohabitans teleogrylli]
MAFNVTHRIAAFTFASSLLFSSGVFAHAHLKSQIPAADATVAAAEQLVLNFSEGVEPAFSGATLTGADNAAIGVGKARLNENDNKQLIIPLNAALMSGDYRVNWHVVSVDGHKTQGSYHFRIQ